MPRDHKPTALHAASCLGDGGGLQSQLGATRTTLRGCIPPQHVPSRVAEPACSSRHCITRGRRPPRQLPPIETASCRSNSPPPNPSPLCHQTPPTQDACQDYLQLSKPANDFHGEAKGYLYLSRAGREGNGRPLQPICQALSKTSEHIVQARSGSGAGETGRGSGGMHYSDDMDFTSRVNFSPLLQTNLFKCLLRQGQEVRRIRHYFGVLVLGTGNEHSRLFLISWGERQDLPVFWGMGEMRWPSLG